MFTPGISFDIFPDRKRFTLKTYPPMDMDITLSMPENEPEFPRQLAEIGFEKILDNVEFEQYPSYSKSFVFNISSWLKKQLNYNQCYMLTCNCLWMMQDLVGELITPQLGRLIKLNIATVVSYLISCEMYPGDFGQQIDFKNAIMPNDFGLKEYDY